ncbi:MAG: glutamate--tRNA ligase [Bacteroidota bacterium]|nr:glutamate--tRNA ligase [Bacteroidota bacterium]MDP4213463.1 glutamate--tRNA ligase [Bacteroidota bacterium]MDP4250049.1 glutamate--tRNA ligase [Bacteroidota bacterium]
MEKKIRVRFAPSPTGGLHLGGVRTALYNYLFARQHQGDFILRIEDTDQSRYIPGAEDYIYETLKWCGLEPDESPLKSGPFGPYRQSERKKIYREYAEKLVQAGRAYYAFDTTEELENMRSKYRTPENPSPQYDYRSRENMRNALSLSAGETGRLMAANTPHVIRIKIPEKETVHLQDMIRGDVSFDTSLLDDKVLLKADGMPTYHLAVVVDDHLMQITHAFRGEEWLPSAPVHVLIWRYLFGEDQMPRWAHFPLILKPDGNGKLSKRDGARLGIPIFAMDWKDPATGETITGFRENGFLPQAFVNMLAVLGWNDGTEQELYSIQELIAKFSIERVHKAGAKFNYEKAKWFNHEWIKKLTVAELFPYVKKAFEEKSLPVSDDQQLLAVIGLVRDRCSLITDFYTQGKFLFETPKQWDLNAIQPKWNEQKKAFFRDYIVQSGSLAEWRADNLETAFKELAAEKNIKAGELQLPLRIMLVGEKTGPPVFEISASLGRGETIKRIQNLLDALGVP